MSNLNPPHELRDPGPVDPVSVRRAVAQAARTSRLDPAEQETLVLAWQRHRVVVAALAQEGDGRRRRPLRSEEAELAPAANALFEFIQARIANRCRDVMSKRYGDEWGASLLADASGDGFVAAMEALGRWDPSRGMSALNFAFTAAGAVWSAIDAGAGPMQRPREWRKIAAVAAVIQAESPHRVFTLDELRDAIWERLVASTVEAMVDTKRSAHELRRLAEERLTRKSLRRVLREELPAVLASDLGVLSLDVPASEGGADLISLVADEDLTTPGMSDDADIAMSVLAGLAPDELAVVLSRYGGDGVAGETYDTIAQRYDLTKSQARAMVHRGKARLTAPHTQWCRLGPDVVGRFRESVGEPVGSAVPL